MTLRQQIEDILLEVQKAPPHKDSASFIECVDALLQLVNAARKGGADRVVEAVAKIDSSAHFVSSYEHNHGLADEHFCEGCRKNGENRQIRKSLDAARQEAEGVGGGGVC